MSLDLMNDFQKHVTHYIQWLEGLQHPLTLDLAKSIGYSLNGGGKRFRPLLGLSLATDFDFDLSPVYPWLFSIEMIHTYSLIHDDLPIMDNDDYRRNRPTNHKVFGPSTALLAGDALISESILNLVKHYPNDSVLALKLIKLLCTAIGPEGMVQGQMLDITSKNSLLNLKDLTYMHRLKTGALIWATLLGTAYILNLSDDQLSWVDQLGWDIGLAFQIKDDLSDSSENIEHGSLPHLIGLDGSNDLLNSTIQRFDTHLSHLNLKEKELSILIYHYLENKGR